MAGNWDRYLAYIHPASHLSLLCISHHILIRKVSRSALEYAGNVPLEEKKQSPVSYSISFDRRRRNRSYSMYHIGMNFSTWWQWMSFQERMISILVPNWKLVEKTEKLRFCYTPASLELHLEDESAKLSNTENQMKSGVGSQPES